MKITQNLKYALAGACFSLSLAAFVPMVHAQAGGGGASTAGSAAVGNGATGNGGGRSATSPSTLGGSVSGSSSSPATTEGTAGDTAIHHGGPVNADSPMNPATATNPATAWNPSKYHNDRHTDMGANRAVNRRERHAMGNQRHHHTYQSTANADSE